MTSWTFFSDVDGWSMDNLASWDETEGYPNAGSILLSPGPGDNGEMSISGLSEISTSITFWYKRESDPAFADITIKATYSDASYDEDTSITTTTSWQGYEFSINPAKTLSEIQIVAAGNGFVWIDTISVGGGDPYGLTVSAGGIPGSILALGPDRAATIESVSVLYTPAVPAVFPSSLVVDVEVSAPTWVNIQATGGTDENQAMTTVSDTFTYYNIPATGTVTVYNLFDSSESGSDTW